MNEYGLVELREITLVMAPERLRVVARFLLEMADEMSGARSSSSWHRHLSSWFPEWDRFEGEGDVIVSPALSDEV